jgi:hypothetical protein
MKFKNGDRVKWSKKPGVWKVVQTRIEEKGVRRYRIQIGTDTADQDWAFENELELVIGDA